MAATRPYFLVHKGETHIIDAPSAAHAVQHVVGADVSVLRPARAAEVSAWVRGGKPIPVAGERAAAAAVESTAGVAATPGANDLIPDPAREGWDADDAKTWLAQQPGGAARTPFYPLSCWASMQRADRMDLEDFDAMRTQVPTFGVAMLGLPAGQATSEADVAQVRAVLETAPMPFAEVVRLIGEAKRHELYVSETGTAGEAEQTSAISAEQ